jgi:hypothetical protein
LPAELPFLKSINKLCSSWMFQTIRVASGAWIVLLFTKGGMNSHAFLYMHASKVFAQLGSFVSCVNLFTIYKCFWEKTSNCLFVSPHIKLKQNCFSTDSKEKYAGARIDKDTRTGVVLFTVLLSLKELGFCII